MPNFMFFARFVVRNYKEAHRGLSDMMNKQENPFYVSTFVVPGTRGGSVGSIFTKLSRIIEWLSNHMVMIIKSGIEI